MNPLPRLNPFVKAAYRASCRGLWTSAWVAGILLVHSVGAAAGSDPSIETAIKTYQEAMRSKDRDERMALFAQAERIFSGAIERGARNPSIETNRANAALQAERRGDAIWGIAVRSRSIRAIGKPVKISSTPAPSCRNGFPFRKPRASPTLSFFGVMQLLPTRSNFGPQPALPQPVWHWPSG